MPLLIRPNQTAFIKDRLLLENTLLASELIQGYHSNKTPKRVTIKVDLAKAFDTVDWGFIITCLRSLHFPEQYLRWITACITTPAYSVGFNGSLHGFFKGKRGLRQGDPLSPYLFVIAMNCLSLLLDKAAAEGVFGYHHRCESLKITHLCFADDLLIFTDGSLSSIKGVISVLEDFHSRSGLGMNTSKTSFFSAGLSPSEIDEITSATGIHHAQLPTTYLGLPLSSRKLSKLTCAPLLQKIKARMTSWAAINLSFAGRLELITSVINGITTFWTSAFIIPKACIKEINTLCAAFLWKGSLEGRYSARVSWAAISVPKKEGGLGLRDLFAWNRMSTMKLVWMLFFRPASLWVAWFRRDILNNNVNLFWTAKTKQRFSWLVRKLLKLRDAMFPWFQMQVGNGIDTYFWHNNWSPYGKLATFLSHDFTTNSGVNRNAKLGDLWINGSWRLPNARTENFVEVLGFLSTITLTSELDSYCWTFPNSSSTNFSATEVYNLIRRSCDEVSWFPEVWFSGSIPRQAFSTWLFILNCSPTRDRLISWGLPTSPMCLLCNSFNESRNHLFFSCSFSSAVWLPLAIRLSLPPTTDWDDILNQLHLIKHRKTLTLLAWQSAIHLLWQERNNRLHRSVFRSSLAILKLIDSLIRNRSSSLRPDRPRFASALIQLWFAGEERRSPLPSLHAL